MVIDTAPDWLLLVVSLPTPNSTARMRIWRALKGLGCVALRDGAYLLPAGAEREQSLRDLADECSREGGVAWLLAVQSRSDEEPLSYRQLFDRSDEYAQLRRSWKETNRTLRTLSMSELLRVRRRMEREYQAVREMDFFPNETSIETDAAWTDFAKRLEALLSPDEPHEGAGGGRRLDARSYP